MIKIITSPKPSTRKMVLMILPLLPLAVGCIMMSCGGSDKPASAADSPAPAPAPQVARITVVRDSVLTLSTSSDATQSYSVYYPSKAGSPDNTPVLICFDPHGDGRIPIDKYRKWADKYGIAVAGSNTSRNGLSAADGQQIAANLIADVSGRLGFAKKNAALCGFSGGSKVAINATSAEPSISNLIFAGAVTQLNSAHTLNILGFAGNQDMNYTDLLQFDESMQSSNPNTVLIEFGGKHEWPDAQTFENAFTWLAFQVWKQNPSAKDSVMIKTFISHADKAIKEAEAKNDWLAAYRECRKAAVFLNGLTDISSYKNQMASIEGNDLYKRSLAQKSAILAKEANTKPILQQAFQDKGLDWWSKVINGYQASADPSDKRLLGYISLASYSYTNQMLMQQNLDGAEHMLAIYELADARNTDQLYFHAMLYAQKGNNALAVKYLQKAVANGFSDLKKLEAEPSFTPLKADPGFAQIEAALKKASR